MSLPLPLSGKKDYYFHAGLHESCPFVFPECFSIALNTEDQMRRVTCDAESKFPFQHKQIFAVSFLDWDHFEY